MKAIDWNQPATFVELFNKIYIHSLNEGFFDLNNPTWISAVTDDLGNGDEITNNLLLLFKENVETIRFYHATRLLFPKKIYREGLKILSEKLVFKLCRQAGYSPKRRERKKILIKYKNYTSIRSDGCRNHIYVQLDKYCDMLSQDNYIQSNCSFFSGGEVLRNVLPSPFGSQVLNILKSRGIPTLIYIDLPISERFLNNDYLVKIANRFFCSWFNTEKLKQEPFSNSFGINIEEPIKGEHIKKIILLRSPIT